MGTNVLNDQWLTAAAVTRRCSEKERESTQSTVFPSSAVACTAASTFGVSNSVVTTTKRAEREQSEGEVWTSH